LLGTIGSKKKRIKLTHKWLFNKLNIVSAMITRKEAEAIFNELGIKAAPKDDPIYNEAPSVRFINRSIKEKNRNTS